MVGTTPSSLSGYEFYEFEGGIKENLFVTLVIEFKLIAVSALEVL